VSLLTIVQDVADRVGIPRTTSVVGSNDMQIRQLLALVNQDGVEIARRHPWQQITKEKVFTTIASETQTSVIPSDFDRFVDGTVYNRTKSRIAQGPLTAHEYQDYKSRLASLVYDAFRVRGNDFLILPTPGAGDNWAFEYVSTWWVVANGETPISKAKFTSDDDSSIFPEELHTLGLTWRYKRSRGLDYAEDFNSYETFFKTLTGRDGGRRILSMGGNSDQRIPRAPTAPDGNWSIT
jgi:hypothetical protein